MHGSRGLRAVIVAVIALFALVPAAGVDAVTSSGSAVSPVAPTAPGYDISWPQCGGPYPVNPAFGIVGANKGIVFSPNPCLASEVTWAGGTSAALYASTGNPGPALSTHWPTGQTSPQVCSATNPDTAACAYDYGYNAAADSYADAVSAFKALGLSGSPAGSPWWLDLEIANSWRSDVTLNVAALSGAVYYLGSVAHVASLGFYATSYQWGVITGGTTTFSAYPSWVAGAADAAGAAANCAGPGFTGGGVTLAQYPSGGFDADLRCSTATPVLTTITVSPATTSVATGGSAQFSATGFDQFGSPISPQSPFTWSVSGGGTVNGSGLFTAGAAAGGPFTVTASSGTVSGTASITVTAPPVLTKITVAPASASVQTGKTQQLTATGLDQFGQPMTPQPPFTWSVSGGGTIATGGLFTAGSTAGGPFTVIATSGTVSGTASVTVTGLPQDFSLSMSPASVSVRRGSTATYTVTVTPSNGFSGSVTLSLSGQPSGSSVTFSPNPATGPSTLSVRTSSSGPRGTFTLTITGRSGTLTHTVTTRLSVTR
jgi:hypothetical protein